MSRLELRIRALVPRPAAPIVVMDGGGEDEGLAARAAEKLAAWGYSNVRLFDGGLEAWRAAGFEIFSGTNVPSKAFGEFVEVTYDTRRAWRRTT